MRSPSGRRVQRIHGSHKGVIHPLSLVSHHSKLVTDSNVIKLQPRVRNFFYIVCICNGYAKFTLLLSSDPSQI
jgi:hypothetical protein